MMGFGFNAVTGDFLRRRGLLDRKRRADAPGHGSDHLLNLTSY
jgi:hypothetical protein